MSSSNTKESSEPEPPLAPPNPNSPRRILIATVTAGGGHIQAARAINHAWRQLQPADDVQTVDLLDMVSRFQRHLYVQSYVKLVEHAPELWGMVFKKTDNPSLVHRLTRLRLTFARATNRRFVKFLRQLQPHAVLCTHYLPVEIMAHVTRFPAPSLTACIITDFEAHTLWLDPIVDLYCVAANETRASLIARCIDPHKVKVTGIPIASDFAQPLNPRSLRKNMGLRDDLPILLILSGGFGLGPVAEILNALERVSTLLQLIVVTGHNTQLRQQLASREPRHPTRLFGYVENIHQLMAVSDLVITKPGGLTASETLALGRPLLIVNPIPGQESANSDFLLERGAAVKINRIEDLPSRIDQLLNSSKLRSMARASKRLGKPNAASSVCHELLIALNHPPPTTATCPPPGSPSPS